MLWAAAAVLGSCLGHAGAWEDCDGSYGPGTFSVAPRVNITHDGVFMYMLAPVGAPADGTLLPAVVFMHGGTGAWEMYDKNFQLYASHGFVVVFPFVKDPVKDRSSFTTQTNGENQMRGVYYLRNATKDPQSPLFNRVDAGNIILNGHSMGAACTIRSAQRLPAGTVKAAIVQHPFICGPFGPPPLPSTWMPAQLAEAMDKVPLLMTTATNDAAFWPAPGTAKHEVGCFGKVTPPRPGTGIVEFTADACAEDGAFKPTWTDGGHDCPFKPTPETPWVLAMMRLYGQLQGSRTSKCYELLWGSGADSLRNSKNVTQAVLHEPTTSALVV